MQADFRVLTPDVFEFVLANELKRAVRSQSYLTLLHLDCSWPDLTADASGERERIVSHLAGVVNREVRETDIIGQSGRDQLSLVLLDADFEDTVHVVERIVARLAYYRFPCPMDITIGGACFPTHGADLESLRREVASRPLLRTQCGAGRKTS